eukprot:UN08588
MQLMLFVVVDGMVHNQQLDPISTNWVFFPADSKSSKDLPRALQLILGI